MGHILMYFFLHEQKAMNCHYFFIVLSHNCFSFGASFIVLGRNFSDPAE